MEVIVGAVTLLALAILIIVTINLKKSTLFSSKYRLYAYFRDVKRLEEGAPVYVWGVVCGEVSKIEASDRRDYRDYPVRVVMMLKRGTILHEGAQARIISAGLLGETEISVEDTSPAASVLEPGEEIYGVPTMDINEALRQAPAVVYDLQKSIAALSAILTDERNRRSFGNLLESASSITMQVDRSLKASSSDITQGIRNIRTATEQLNQVLAHADTTLTSFGRNLSAAATSFNGAIADLRTSAGVLMNRLSSAAGRIDETTNKADRLLTIAGGILEENRDEIHRTMAALTSATVHLGQILSRVDEGRSPLAEVVMGPKPYADLSLSLAKLEHSMDILRRWLDGLDRWWTGAGRDRPRVDITYEGVTTGTARKRE